jgi:hypothetical protein
LIQHCRDVRRTQDEVLQAGRLLHRHRDVSWSLALPHGFIAARMLHEDDRVAACGRGVAKVPQRKSGGIGRVEVRSPLKASPP